MSWFTYNNSSLISKLAHVIKDKAQARSS